MSTCHCGGDADACAEHDEHTGPERASAAARDHDSAESSPWMFGRCSACGSATSVSRHDRVCHPCLSARTRAYFASDEARDLAWRVLGTPEPTRFGDVMTVAVMRARKHGRPVPDGLDVRLARARIDSGER